MTPTRTGAPTAEQLAGLLRARVRGAVDTSARRRAEYSSDASNYRVVPEVVVLPEHVDEVLEVLDVCRATGVPLTARGGGTSVAGNAVGPGVVVDLGRHLTRVLAVDPAARTAVVEPGAVLDDLQRAAAPYGLRFGPDPSTHARCTLGGMLGNDACGPHGLTSGRTSDNVEALDVVTGAGQRLRAGRGGPLPVAGLEGLVGRHRATLRTELGRFGRQVSGYPLHRLLPENGRDLAKALVGTEGTCALVLAATVRLVPLAPATALVVLGYEDLAAAAEGVPAVLPHAPLAVEGIDARLVDVVRARGQRGAVPDLPPGGAWSFVEVGGATAREARAAAGRVAPSAGALGALVVHEPAQARALWRVREDGVGLAGRTPAGRPAWPGLEDAAVPPEVLGPYLRDAERLLRSHGLDGLAYGHLGEGCVHVRVDFPLAEDPGRFRAYLEDAARLVASYGGSVSGEHGDGRARGELLRHLYSPDALAAFEGFKGLLDPDDVLNPGVLVRPRPLDADLRLPAARPLDRGLAFALAEDGGDLTTAVHRCTGVGKCRADLTPAGGAMCPSYLATRDERDSTRGRARVLQEMANGSLVQGGWRSPEVHDVLDLCLQCKACASDCPAGVDMATYKAEVLHQAYRGRPRPRSHYALGRLPVWLRLAGRAPRAADRVLRSAPVAALAKRAAGMDPRRPLPALAPETFRAWWSRRPVTRQGDPVVLWVDTFTDALAPEVGRAAVAVLEAAGLRAVVPDEPACCGLTYVTTGQLDGARRRMRATLDALAPHVAAGLPVVGLEPSCTATLRSDLVGLLPGDPRAEAVRDATTTLAELLARHRPGWEPPSLAGTRVVAQPHCHHRAVMGWDADRALLERAGAEVEQVGGCCGLAGSFGVERGHYEVSVAVAEHALLPAVRAEPSAVVLADGYSCRLQLDDLAQRRGVHLAQLLADRLP
ncbi:FAD-binding and (Fe-S)-binding domain-containing protein [Vallicoccus soli]|uniref:FAD-binding and (Fe-S)-binding domain-containing protein n=1 Tax=Vallicoccus soli TaxID=2339232 RepID=UPI001C49A451|nr:FAD-binding and (Fe-S)-binding domain-containing protein [Vallicoccus soli]